MLKRKQQIAFMNRLAARDGKRFESAGNLRRHKHIFAFAIALIGRGTGMREANHREKAQKAACSLSSMAGLTSGFQGIEKGIKTSGAVLGEVESSAFFNGADD